MSAADAAAADDDDDDNGVSAAADDDDDDVVEDSTLESRGSSSRTASGWTGGTRMTTETSWAATSCSCAEESTRHTLVTRRVRYLCER